MWGLGRWASMKVKRTRGGSVIHHGECCGSVEIRVGNRLMG